MFIRLHANDKTKAELQGIECPTVRVEFNNGKTVVVVVPGHSYSIGSRNSLLKRGYAPACRQIFTVVEVVDNDHVLNCTKIAEYNLRKD